MSIKQWNALPCNLKSIDNLRAQTQKELLFDQYHWFYTDINYQLDLYLTETVFMNRILYLLWILLFEEPVGKKLFHF